ncbi:MAG: hypothetical protein M5U12_13940 [Verrucomicrobia bacterium]|nr:hypothetical protein [Verrucomicrobiota bacterium]
MAPRGLRRRRGQPARDPHPKPLGPPRRAAPLPRRRPDQLPAARPTPAPAPIPLPEGADSVQLWLHGNRWEWENPPDTPPVRLTVQLRDGSGNALPIALGPVRWKEWWLVHRKLPPGLKGPLLFERLVFEGGSQPEPRDLFLDSLRGYRENLPPLKFAPRPERNLRLFTGQSPGANTGPGRLPFPTREETILPRQLAGEFTNEVGSLSTGGYRFTYRGSDGVLHYDFLPAAGLPSLRATFNAQPIGQLMLGAQVLRTTQTPTNTLTETVLTNGILSARYDDGTQLRLRLWQKSLVLDVINQTGQATEFSCGEVAGLDNPALSRCPSSLTVTDPDRSSASPSPAPPRSSSPSGSTGTAPTAPNPTPPPPPTPAPCASTAACVTTPALQVSATPCSNASSSPSPPV